MARIFVTNDAETIRVTVTPAHDQDDEGAHIAVCSECKTNVVANTHEQWSLEDTIQMAELHIDHKH